MNIAVFGTRTLGDFKPVDDFVMSLPTDDTLLLIDGKLGVSNYAKNKASFQMIPIRTYPANYKRDGIAADFIRNHRIIDDAEEVFVFFNKIDEVLRDIVDYCTKVGKPCTVTEVRGELVTEL